jgi:hypothetical protein
LDFLADPSRALCKPRIVLTDDFPARLCRRIVPTLPALIDPPGNPAGCGDEQLQML